MKRIMDMEQKVRALEKMNIKLSKQLAEHKQNTVKIEEENKILREQLLGANKKIEILLKGISEISQNVGENTNIISPIKSHEKSVTKMSEKTTFETTFGSGFNMTKSPKKQQDLRGKFGKYLINSNSKIISQDDYPEIFKDVIQNKDKQIIELKQYIGKIKNSLEELVQN